MQSNLQTINSIDKLTVPPWLLMMAYVITLTMILILYPSVSPIIIVLGIIVVFLTIYYPEISLVAFVLIGVTKPWIEENVAIFQTIDYTLFLALCICVLMLITVLRHQTGTSAIFLHLLPVLLILAILLFVGIIYSSAPSYGFQKAIRFFIYNLLIFIATIIFIKNKRDIVRTLALIVVLSGVFAVIMFYQGFRSLAEGDLSGMIIRMTILGANPIPSARIFSLSFLILLVAAYYSTKSRNKYLLYPVSGLFLIALIVTNTRGPLLSTIAAVIVFALLLSEMKYKTIVLYLFLFGAVMASAFLFLPDFVTSRYESLVAAGTAQRVLEGGEVDTISARFMMWKMAFGGMLESVWSFFFGHGTGHFSTLFHLSDIRWYPHNLFAEIAYEIGIIGLLILFLHLGQIYQYTIILWNKTKQKDNEKIVTAVIIVITIGSFMAAMVSGDITDNRYIWFHFGLIIACWKVFVCKQEGLRKT